MLNPLRGRVLASVDIVFVSPPPTSSLVNWVANTKANSYKPAVHSCMHSSCRAICRFCHKSSVGSRGFGALGRQGNFYASKHKFTYSGTKLSSVTKISLPFMAAYPTHINCFSSAPQRFWGFFLLRIPSNSGVCTSLLFYSFICHWNAFPILLIFWRIWVVRDKNSGSKAFHFSLTWKQDTESLIHLCCSYHFG